MFSWRWYRYPRIVTATATAIRTTAPGRWLSPESIRLYRAIVAEADRMPGLGRLFWKAGPRQVRAAIAQLWAEEHDAATAPVVAEQLVQLALGDAYQELVLGTGTPAPEVFERQIDAALGLLGVTLRRRRQ
jgi:TetR/AcrR family transcriptional regulator, mexJK operon transcriptional repressor